MCFLDLGIWCQGRSREYLPWGLGRPQKCASHPTAAPGHDNHSFHLLGALLPTSRAPALFSPPPGYTGPLAEPRPPFLGACRGDEHLVECRKSLTLPRKTEELRGPHSKRRWEEMPKWRLSFTLNPFLSWAGFPGLHWSGVPSEACPPVLPGEGGQHGTPGASFSSLLQEVLSNVGVHQNPRWDGGEEVPAGGSNKSRLSTSQHPDSLGVGSGSCALFRGHQFHSLRNTSLDLFPGTGTVPGISKGTRTRGGRGYSQFAPSF